jgi:hypothetical protein
MSDCLHCEIIQLVQERIDSGEGDVSDLAAMIVEALAELILLAPEAEQSKVMADALAHLGHMFLEKSGALSGEQSRASH